MVPSNPVPAVPEPNCTVKPVASTAVNGCGTTPGGTASVEVEPMIAGRLVLLPSVAYTRQ